MKKDQIKLMDHFGRLTVVGEGQMDGQQRKHPCLCECGNLVAVRNYSLLNGATVSCGCHKAEQAAVNARKHSTTHGMAGTDVYKIWKGIKKRCRPGYFKRQYYYDRGISVCEEWSGQNGFELFYSHIGQRPSQAHTVDRKDNDKGYEPGNVRWATYSTQRLNQRRCL